MLKRIDTVFLAKWQKEYYERDDREAYTNRIKKDTLTSEDIKFLLEWKSTRFKKKIKGKLTSPEIVKKINALRKKKTFGETEVDEFVKMFYPGYPNQAPVLGTFIKHLIKPDEFPLYDQYVHEAYHDLMGVVKRADCLIVCYKDYSAFFMEIQKKLQCSSKKLDEALWAYGYSLAS